MFAWSVEMKQCDSPKYLFLEKGREGFKSELACKEPSQENKLTTTPRTTMPLSQGVDYMNSFLSFSFY